MKIQKSEIKKGIVLISVSTFLGVLITIFLDASIFSRISPPVSELSLELVHDDFIDCRIIDSIHEYNTIVLLLESKNHSIQVITLEKSIFSDRYRISPNGVKTLHPNILRYSTAIRSMYVDLPVTIVNYSHFLIEENTLVQEYFHWRLFFSSYGVIVWVAFGAGLLIWTVIVRKKVLKNRHNISYPFEDVELRHPVGSRRQAIITGKYGGGVFCNLPDGTVCMCSYSYQHEDSDFRVGDTVILLVQRYDVEKRQMYGKILSKW